MSKSISDRRRAQQPLKITCTSTDCESNLHCFRQKQRNAPPHGPCRECGAELVNWPRVHAREIHDAENTTESLKYELIRHHYWHKPVVPKAIKIARRKGLKGLRSAVHRRLSSKTLAPDNAWDGRQTPLEGNIIYYAQHATAICCRKCLEVWHGIPKERSLTSDDIAYISELAMLYIVDRLPNLTEDGETLAEIVAPKEGNVPRKRP